MRQKIIILYILMLIVSSLTIHLQASPLDVSTRQMTATIKQGQDASNQTFTVHNTGDERINYALSSRQHWIRVQPVRGSLQQNQSTRHQVQLNTRRLRTGQHRGTVEIRSPALAQPKTIDIVVNIEEPVELRVSPGAIDTSISPGQRVSDLSFHVSSTSPPSVRYQIRSSAGWITVSPGYGTAHHNRQQRHRVTISTQHLRSGTYHGSISIISPDAVNSPLEIPVRITIDDEPALEVTPHNIRHRLRRNEILRDETITIRNTGTQTISYRVRTDTHWIEVFPQQGRIAPRRSHNLDLEYSIGRLHPGTHRARIIIESPDIRNVRKEIPVEIVISQRELVRIVPPELNLFARADMERGRSTISIQNLSYDNLNYSIRNYTPWMHIQPQRGWLLPNRSKELVITFYLSNMPYGPNRGYFEIELPEHYEEPIRVPVHLNRRSQ